jgi:hypothetical protein
MSFNIVDYKKNIEQRLAPLAFVYRKLFAIWCVQAIFDFYRQQPSVALHQKDVQFVRDTITMLWENVLMDTLPSILTQPEIEKWCHEIEVDQDGLLQSILLAQLLGGLLSAAEVFSSGSSKQSSLLAEYIINCIDAEISERTGVSPRGDLSFVPEIAAELNGQEEMIRYLESSPKLSIEDVARLKKSRI